MLLCLLLSHIDWFTRGLACQLFRWYQRSIYHLTCYPRFVYSFTGHVTHNWSIMRSGFLFTANIVVTMVKYNSECIIVYVTMIYCYFNPLLMIGVQWYIVLWPSTCSGAYTRGVEMVLLVVYIKCSAEYNNRLLSNRSLHVTWLSHSKRSRVRNIIDGQNHTQSIPVAIWW